VRHFFASEYLVENLAPVELTPGVEDYPDGSEELDGWLRRVLSPSTGHPVGTCSLAPLELGGVIGPDLRVYGTRRLSVADNSVMPLIPGTHTSSTAYAIGEKAADLIKRRAGWWDDAEE
jgi:choline dehydrogenase-like flavoprotein